MGTDCRGFAGQTAVCGCGTGISPFRVALFLFSWHIPTRRVSEGPCQDKDSLAYASGCEERRNIKRYAWTTLSIRANTRSLPITASVSNMPNPAAVPVVATRKA
ncbi:hypothetical protein Rcae01_03753 [Novipirellula caenicola]|uniref:Uncharacterized protein n=1 Tax=Novipirellula caenicola TaxID=1536901 RepID=A0ABP9VSZ6_9BACT